MNEGDRIRALNPAEVMRENDALRVRVTELEAVIAELRAELERVKRRQQRQAAPFSKETHVAQPKRLGRKPGQGVFRYRHAPVVDADGDPPRVVPVVSTACPHCGGELGDAEVELASVTDLPERPQPVVRRYAVSVRRCTSCQRPVRGRHPDVAADQYGSTAHRLGERILAAGQALHYGHGVPQRKVPAILAALTGIAVTQSALQQHGTRQTAGPIGAVYQQLRTGMAHTPRVHTDDTGWRIGGRPAQLMAFTTETETVFQIRNQHRNEEVREVIPADFAGVLCCDRGKSYDAQQLRSVKQQKCLAHIQRSITTLLETKWGRGRSFGLAVRRLLREAIALWHAERDGTAPDFRAQATRLQEELTVLVRERPMPDSSNQCLCDDLRRRHARGEVLRFLEDPRIEPTNNRAERALRPAVIARKVSQCSKNDAGAATFAAYASVSRTLVQRGAPLIEGLVALSAGAPLPPPPS